LGKYADRMSDRLTAGVVMVGVCLDLTTGLLGFFESPEATDEDFDSLPCSKSGVRGDFSIGLYEPIGSVNPNLDKS
jgi:hypothetical protein